MKRVQYVAPFQEINLFTNFILSKIFSLWISIINTYHIFWIEEMEERDDEDKYGEEEAKMELEDPFTGEYTPGVVYNVTLGKLSENLRRKLSKLSLYFLI